MEGGDFCAQGDQAGDLRVFAKGGTSRFSKTWYGIPHLCKGGLLPPDFRRGILHIFAKDNLNNLNNLKNLKNLCLNCLNSLNSLNSFNIL